jgi:hypothetical protein
MPISTSSRIEMYNSTTLHQGDSKPYPRLPSHFGIYVVAMQQVLHIHCSIFLTGLLFPLRGLSVFDVRRVLFLVTLVNKRSIQSLNFILRKDDFSLKQARVVFPFLMIKRRAKIEGDGFTISLPTYSDHSCGISSGGPPPPPASFSLRVACTMSSTRNRTFAA